jgi:hypothetical protein
MTPYGPLTNAIKDIARTETSSFATTQAVWRFLNNDRISFEQLNEPILKLARQEILQSQHKYALVMHDWSRLQYYRHGSKSDRQKIQVQNEGYDLRGSLLVDASTGLPVAPLVQTLTTQTSLLSTLGEKTCEPVTHLNSLVADITQMEHLGLEKTLVHIIDREGDSISHLNAMNNLPARWVIRGVEGRLAEHDGKTKKLINIAHGLCFKDHAEVEYRGQQAKIAVSEAPVVIKRVSRAQGEHVRQVPLHVRLVVVRLSNHEKTLGYWMLLTNVDAEVQASEIAQWYYWRWSIESFFKLIKSAGHDVESWLQKTPEAILRRLLIASMACVLAWRIQRAQGEGGQKTRQIICRLSGRQQKRGRRESAPAILAGLSILLNTLALLEEYSHEELIQLANSVMWGEEDV